MEEIGPKTKVDPNLVVVGEAVRVTDAGEDASPEETAPSACVKGKAKEPRGEVTPNMSFTKCMPRTNCMRFDTGRFDLVLRVCISCFCCIYVDVCLSSFSVRREAARDSMNRQPLPLTTQPKQDLHGRFLRCLPGFAQVLWCRWRWSRKDNPLVQQGAAALMSDAPSAVRADKVCVLAAVKQDGHALEYASDGLKADKEVVLAAVSENGNAASHADKKAPIWAEKEFVLSIVRLKGIVLQLAADSFKSDKEVVQAAVANDGVSLWFAADHLKRDKEVVLAAVLRNGDALQYASEDLRRDKEVVLAACQPHYEQI